LGIDDQGREILSFLPGRVATYPLDDFLWSDRILVRVAQMLRAYHDATADFVVPAGAAWQWPAHEPAEVICHNDFCPYNLTFEGTELVGVIDFDLASPGPRVWDMATTAYRFVALTDPQSPDAPYMGRAQQTRRLAAFCRAYGDERIAGLRELVEFIETSAAAGDPAQRPCSGAATW
jgi:Ser/Thr protein kinase RdoA (MazF antagonist)